MDDKGDEESNKIKKKKKEREAANLLRRGEESKWRFRRDVQTWTNFTPASPPPLLPPSLLLPFSLLHLFFCFSSSLLSRRRRSKTLAEKQSSRGKCWLKLYFVLIPPGLLTASSRSLSPSLSQRVSLPLNLISKAHHVLSRSLQGDVATKHLSLYAHSETR